MAKMRSTQNICAVVAQDAAGHWITRGAGRARVSDDSSSAIRRALYGKHPVPAVLLVPRDSID